MKCNYCILIFMTMLLVQAFGMADNDSSDSKIDQRQIVMNDSTILEKHDDTDVMLKLARSVIVAHKDAFRNYLNRDGSSSAINIDDALLTEDLAWLEQFGSDDIPKATYGDASRLEELMEFICLLAYDANNGVPFGDEKLFKVYLDFYQSTTPFVIYWGKRAMPYFSKRLLQNSAEIVLKPYIDGRFRCDEICRLNFDVEFCNHYRDFFDKCIAENNSKIQKLRRADGESYFDLLKQNAGFGDKNARDRLLELFDKCKATMDSDDRLQSLLRCLGGGCHNDVAVALLRRFNDVGIDRYGNSYGVFGEAVWNIFVRWYPDDEFILKYHERIGDFHDGKYDGTDKETKQFFKELKKWAKDKFNFDLILPPERMSFVKFERQYVDYF